MRLSKYSLVYNPTMKKPLTFYTIILLFLVSLIHSLTGCDSSLREKQINEVESHKQAIRIDPDDAEAHFGLGFAYGESGKYQEAIESYKQAIRINPDLAGAHFGLGFAYGESGKYKEAIESYKQAIRINPDLADAHYNLGLAYKKSGMYKEAIESFKQAIKA